MENTTTETTNSKKKNGAAKNGAPDGAPETQPENGATEQAAAPTPVDPARRRALFEDYEVSESKVTALLDELEKAQAERSVKIGAIAKECGKGPFMWNGTELTLAKTKTEGQWTFRRRLQKDIVQV